MYSAELERIDALNFSGWHERHKSRQSLQDLFLLTGIYLLRVVPPPGASAPMYSLGPRPPTAAAVCRI